MARELLVKVRGDVSDLSSKMGVAQSSIGKLGIAAAGAATVIGGIGVAAVAGLAKLGEEFDSAYDTIAIGTGATGEALDGLTQSFDNVLSSGPYSFDQTAASIADLNTRLGVSGEPLEALSAQFLDLSRITETDVAGNVETWTQAFAKFGVPAEEMGENLDAMFRASQASGATMDELGGALTRFGAPLQGLGFSLDESTALLANFELAGVNTQSAMGGMTRALGELARDGEDAPTALARITEQIANMEDPSEATGLAVELFGTRAGPEMAAAIRSGQFDLENMLSVIEDGEGTISGTAASTDDWREKLQTLRNKILVKLAPLAEKVFGAITSAVEKFSIWIEDHWPEIEAIMASLMEWIKDNVVPVIRQMVRGAQVLLANLQSFWERWGDRIIAVVRPLVEYVGRTFQRMWSIIKSVFDLIGDVFSGDWEGVWENAKAIVGTVIEQIVDTIRTRIQVIIEIVKGFGPSLLEGAKALWGKLWEGLQTLWDEVLLPGLKRLPGLIVEGLGALGSLLLSKGSDLLSGLWNGIQGIWTGTVWPWLQGLPGTVVGAIPDLLSTLGQKGADLLGGLWDGISGVWDDTIKPWLADLGSTALLAIPALYDSITSRGRQLLNGAWNGIRGVWNDTIKPWLAKIGSTALTAIPGLYDSITSRGRQLLNGMWNGVRGVWNDTIKPWLGRIGTTALLAVPSLLTSISSRGRQLLNGMWNGIRGVWNDTLYPWFTGLTVRIANAVGSLWTVGSNFGGSLVRGFVNGLGNLGSELWSKFKSAVNTLIRAWNNLSFTLGGGSYDPLGRFGPTVTVPSFTINTPNISQLHTGGWPDGTTRGDVPTILQTGEYIASRGEVSMVGALVERWATLEAQLATVAEARRDDVVAQPVSEGDVTLIVEHLEVGTADDLPAARAMLEDLMFRVKAGTA